MDNTPKFKIHSRHKKKNEKKSHSSAKDKRRESPRDSRRSKQETPVKAMCSKSIADLHSCYQFIENEPVIVWGSPHVSPSYELRAKPCCSSTPQHRLKDEARFRKPVRKLIKGTNSPTQFLRGLMDFTEQRTSDKIVLKEDPDSFVDYGCSMEVPLSVEVSACALSDTDKFLPTSPKYRPCPEEIEQIKKDGLQALFDDGDDDIMLKCSQEMEDIIKVTNPELETISTGEQEIVRMCKESTPEPNGGKLRCKKEGTERTPKNKKQTKVLSSKFGGSSSKKDGCDVLNKSPRNNAIPQCKKAVESETRKSPRLRGGAVSVHEEAEDFGRESFEDILKRLVGEDFPVSPGSPQRKLPLRLSGPESACDPRSNLFETGRRKGTPRSTRANANLGPLKSEILEYFKCEEEDLNESDLVKALDVVESQTIQCSPPFKCTPEEILQKKLEAKRRLAKKKLSRHKETANSFSMLLKPKR